MIELNREPTLHVNQYFNIKNGNETPLFVFSDVFKIKVCIFLQSAQIAVDSS